MGGQAPSIPQSMRTLDFRRPAISCVKKPVRAADILISAVGQADELVTAFVIGFGNGHDRAAVRQGCCHAHPGKRNGLT